MSAIALSANPVLHSRTKHMNLDIYFVRELVEKEEIEVKHVPALYQKADILTKPLSTKYFINMRNELSVHEYKEGGEDSSA